MKNKLTYKKGQPYPLGVKNMDNEVQLCTIITEEKPVTLNLYKKNHKSPALSIPITEQFMYGNIASIHIAGVDAEKYEYSYAVDDRLYVDDYAVSINDMGKFGENTHFYDKKCRFLSNFDWENVDCPRIPFEEIILYRLHVRGFTKHTSSNIKNKGTFSGIIEKIPYLKELGINQVEFMPVYEFLDTLQINDNYKIKEDETDYKCNYWGYSGENRYFAAKSSYATRGVPPDYELKSMIKELHKNNIEVILEFYFPEKTEYGIVIECLKFWTVEYRVDGFHLSGCIPYIEMIAKEPMLSNVKIYADYFPENKAFSVGNNNYRHLATSTESYKQTVRAFLKSDMCRCEEVAAVMKKDSENIGSINYICSHDGFTIVDMVSYERKHNELNGENNLDGTDYNFTWNCGIEGKTRKNKILKLRRRQMKNAWMFLLFSKGVPAILAGDELCNSQSGNNNAYCQDNALGWVNWKSPKYYESMKDYVKALIAIRKRFGKIWRRIYEDSFNINTKRFPHISYHGEKAWQMGFRPTDRSLGIMYYAGEDYENGDDVTNIIYIAYNMNWIPGQFALPKLPGSMSWYKLVDTALDDSIIEGEEKINKIITVKERSCVLLMAK